LLFFVIDYIQYGLANGLQGGFIDDVHVVVNGMPEVAKAGVALGVVVDDIYTRDAGILVHVEVVVGHFHAFGLGEERTES